MIIFTKGEKFVKVCLHSSKVVQISLYFDEFMRFRIFREYAHVSQWCTYSATFASDGIIPGC